MGSGFGFTGDLGGSGENMDLGALFTQLGKIFSGGQAPENLIRDIARSKITTGDWTLGEQESADIISALHLADLWLNEATMFPSALVNPKAWSKAEWVESTLAGWNALIGPMTKTLSEGLNQSLKQMQNEFGMDGANNPFAAFSTGPMAGIFEQMTSMMLAQQVGNTVGELAKITIGSSDACLPLAPKGVAALIPANVKTWGEGMGIDDHQIRTFLALREVATTRLLTQVPWLKDHLVSTISRYSQGIHIDVQAISDQAMNVMNAIENGADPRTLFTPDSTPEQEQALADLENLLALIEGWVTQVVSVAIAGRLPAQIQLEEISRRQRATSNASTALFQSLVGLEVSPRLTREATNFWVIVEQARGITGRDDLWSHAGLLPNAAAIKDPDKFIQEITIPDDLSGLEP